MTEIARLVLGLLPVTTGRSEGEKKMNY